MMMNQPLISVVVPCYNVEKYIDKSISSVLNQTYKNLEVLLINDGSTDETGKLCDVWQAKDPRIKVIHQQNQGSSFARKTGVENASAEYITFMDADDWINENMYANMMSALLSTNSDIAQCGVCDAFEDGSIQHRVTDTIDGSYEIVDRIKGVLFIIESKKWQSYLPNKIFKKHLFNHIEFPKRGLSEDSTIMPVLFHHAAQTVYLQDEYYHYLHRSGSITNSDAIKTSKMKNMYDTYKAFYERYCFVERYPEYHACLLIAKNDVISRGLRVLRNSIIHPQYFPQKYDKALLKHLKSIPFTRKDMLKDFFTPLMSVELSFFLICSALYIALIKFYAKIH